MRVAKELVAINKVIEALEFAGYSVHMCHEVFDPNIHVYDSQALPWSHSTSLSISFIDEEDGEMYEEYIGVAYCSVKDRFSTAIGAQTAFGRAMANMSEELTGGFIKEVIKEYEDYMIFVDNLINADS